MILVDTSVWIDFLADRPAAKALQELLLANEVAFHPAVQGELAVGNLKRRSFISDLAQLSPAPVVADELVLELVERRRLYGIGIGWIDAHLLASAESAQIGIWTLDRPLLNAARRLGLAAPTR